MMLGPLKNNMQPMSSVFSLRLLRLQLSFSLLLLLLKLGDSQNKTYTWADIQPECRRLCPFQETVDTGSSNLSCNASCQTEHCSRGCSVWHEALYSSCVQFCDEPDSQRNSTQGLYCLMGCNYGITTYAERVKKIIGIPHAPMVENNSSVVFRWDNVAYRYLNITYLIQWRYVSKDLPMEWKYLTNVSIPASANNYVLQNLKPFTKYKFRLAMVISPERSPVFSAESSTIITNEGGAPETVQRLSLIAMDSRRVSVNWVPPLFPHAPLLAYVIKLVELPLGYAAVKEIAAADSTGSYLFGQLKPNTTYDISVAARNKYGEGDSVTGKVLTGLEAKSQNDRHPYLLTSRQNQIFKLSLDILEVPEVLFNHSSTITGMAVHVREDVLFVADADNSVIEISLSRRQYLTTVISSAQLPDHKIHALRTDWLNNHLYILLEGKCGTIRSNTWCIARCSLSGKDFRFLTISLRQRPTGFEVDPYNGYLFWNSKGPSGGIFRFDLDPKGGSALNERKMYASPDLQAFVVDYANMRLLVSDVRQNTILSMTLSALEVTDIRANAQNPKFEDVSSLVVYNDLFFWTSGHDLYTEEYEKNQNMFFHNLYSFPLSREPFTTLLLVHVDGQPVPIPSTPVGKLQALFGVNEAKVYWQPPLLPGERTKGAWHSWEYEIVVIDEKRGSQILERKLNTTETELRHLRSSTDYTVRVRALSSEGAGPWTDSPFCGSTLTAAAIPPTLLWATTDGLIEASPIGHNISFMAHRVALQGILKEPFQCTSLAWVDDLIYMTMNNSKLLMINTTSRVVALLGKVEASCIAVDFLGRRLYWSSPRTQLIIRGLLNGSNPESLPLLAMAKQMEIDSLKGKLFWSTGHSVEGSLLNGIDRRVFWNTGLFSGKRVMGIALTENDLYWAVRSSDETAIYRSSTNTLAAFAEVSRLDSVFLGPLQTLSNKLLWLQEDDSTAMSDLRGKNLSVLNSVSIVGSTCFLAKDHSSRELQRNLQVIPSSVKEDSIVIFENETDIFVTWDNTTDINYGDVTYDILLTTVNYELSVATSINTVVIPREWAIPPYSLISVSVKPFTVWGSAMASASRVRSPSSTPSVPLKPRAFVSHRKLPFQQPETVMKFRWDHPARPNGVVTSYKVYWKIFLPETTNYSSSLLPGDDTEFVLDHITSNSSYAFAVEAYTQKGTGPRTDPVVVSAATEFPVPKLLLITMDALWLMDVDRDATGSVYPGKVPHPPIAVTYISHEDTLFWIDEMQEIFSKTLNQTSRTKIKQLKGHGSSLAADWVSRNLYWSEDYADHSSIQRLDLNKDNEENSSEILIKSNLPLRVIETDPFTSRLLYTERLPAGTKRLMVAGIDGLNTRELFSRSSERRRRSVNQCNCRENPAVAAVGAIDRSVPQHPKLLWVDYYSSDIWSSDLEGCYCQLEVNATLYERSGLPPSSLASDASRIYWTNTTEGRVYSLPRGNSATYTKSASSRFGALREGMQSTEVEGLRGIKPLGEHLQPFPGEECLVPTPSAYTATLKDITADSLTLVLPPAERPAQCQNVSMATVLYTISYGAQDSGCDSNEKNCLTKDTFKSTLTLSNLRPYTNYTVRVSLSNFYSKLRIDLVAGTPVTFLTKPGVPSAPRDIQVQVNTPTSVEVRWLEPLNINGANVTYEVHWRSEGLIEGVRPKGEKRSTGSQFSASISNLIPGQEYQFWVRAITLFGGQNDSTTVHSRLFAPPNALRQVQSSSTALVLSWIPHPEIQEFFLEYRPQYAHVWKRDATEKIGPKETSFTLRDLEPKSTYIARLLMLYRTNHTYMWPSEDLFFFETQGDIPSPPTKPVVTEKRRGLYQVTWETAKPNGYAVTIYQLQAKLTEGNSYWRTVYNGTENFWVILGLENHEKYSFRVRALNEKGWSAFSSDSVEYQLADLVQHMNDPDNFINLLMWISLLTLSCVVVPIVICCITRRCRRAGKKTTATILPLPDVELQALPRAELSPLRELPATLVSSANALYRSGHGSEDAVALPHVGKDNITLTKFLGSGAFGEVFEGLARGIASDGQELRVAVKTLRKGATDQEKAEFLKEAELMSHFKHDHILRLLGVCLETDPNFLLLELMEGGDLLSFLRANRPSVHNPCTLTLLGLVTMCVDVAKGCQYLEELHFVHRDLAARNCLVSTNDIRNRVVKIGDFGLARDIYRNDYYRKEGEGLLPVRWMAPESLVDGVFTCQSDVWSFGVLLWEIMTLGQQPYPARTNLQVLHFVRSGGRLDRPPNCPDALHGLMLQCWSYCAEERPSFHYCLEQLTLLQDLLMSQPLTAVNNGYYVSGHCTLATDLLADPSGTPGFDMDVDGNHNSPTESQSRSQSVRYLELVSEDGYEIPKSKSQEGTSGTNGDKILPCSLRLWKNDEDLESITTEESTVPNSPAHVEDIRD